MTLMLSMSTGSKLVVGAPNGLIKHETLDTPDPMVIFWVAQDKPKSRTNV
eukprot:CAMPEP_0171042146 /NCGR_PEP_ID=MMETSP0736-20130129/46115_1 /TAXON_ID=186038 /ORGANISM="Fragilariopsis kerguelensis, Strain L26-C5" /LENGTH=49 /DNA_ID=CAMNT_0011490639 /DNA_START=452 /DNA_END=601 /DNA_ORIENTATION=-